MRTNFGNCNPYKIVELYMYKLYFIATSFLLLTNLWEDFKEFYDKEPIFPFWGLEKIQALTN